MPMGALGYEMTDTGTPAERVARSVAGKVALQQVNAARQRAVERRSASPAEQRARLSQEQVHEAALANSVQRLLDSPPPGSPYADPDFRRLAVRQASDARDRANKAGHEAAQIDGSWGRQFTTSPQWLGRSGHVSRGAAQLETRLSSADLDGGGQPWLIPGGTAPDIAPIASRCTRAGRVRPGDAGVLRWSGPLRPAPGVTAEGDVKPAADGAPEVVPLDVPYRAAYVEVTRQVLEDNAALAGVIDGRLRRALGLALDDLTVAALLADDIPAADSMWAAIGDMASYGYAGQVALLINPADYPEVAPTMPALTVAGVTALLASPGIDAGTCVVADLAAAVTTFSYGAAQVQTLDGNSSAVALPPSITSDSNGQDFLINQMIILAEVRFAAAISDPSAARIASSII